MSETKRECAASYRKPPLHTRFKKGQSGNPRGRLKKNLPALLVAEPAYVTTNARRRNNESAGAKLRKKDRGRTSAGAAPVRPVGPTGELRADAARGQGAQRQLMKEHGTNNRA
jgi:Family of unknown function (DUF5681)